jgi:hypothetical protein
MTTAIVSTPTLKLLATPLGADLADLAAGDRLSILGSVHPDHSARLHVRVVAARRQDHVGLVGYVPMRSNGRRSIRFLEPPPRFWWLTASEVGGRWRFVPPIGWMLGGAAILASLLIWAVK